MAKKTKPGRTGDSSVQAQYEALPYPARDPRDEAKRLITGSPGHLLELNHFVFAGGRDFSKPFRVLVAGGGTGDATLMLAQQLADAGCPAEVLQIDLSAASLAIAGERAKARKLKNVTFRRLSLLDLPGSGLGPFDYIDCCGVLHHLEDPVAGLRALESVLAEDGGMGLMIYGELGRTGVYPFQDMMRMLPTGEAPADRLAVAGRLLKQLPPSNWLRRNPFLADHLQGGDAGLFDLLLHSRDRAYRVPEVAELAAAAGMRLTAFIEPAAYDPASFLSDPELRAQFESLDWLERCAFAELLTGNRHKHIFYAVKAANTGTCVADPGDEDVIPLFRDPADTAFKSQVRPGGLLATTLGGLKVSFPVPPLGAAILSRIDGQASIGAIRTQVRDVNPGLDAAAFDAQFAGLYAALNGLSKLFLSRFPIAIRSGSGTSAPR